MIRILNKIHALQWYTVLSTFCSLMYLLKYRKWVKVNYHRDFRAYSFNDNQYCFMSLGPGWAYTQQYLEEAALNTYNYLYKPKIGDCVIDIGAGLGEESMVYANWVGPSGKVIAIEANPTTFAGLSYAARKNKFNQLLPVNKALYDKEAELFIEDDDRNYLTNTVSESDTGGGFKVKANSFDQIILEHKLNSIDFVKVNIEGAEQYLITGMKDSLDKVKHVCISCHDFRHNYHQHGIFYVTKEKVKKFLMDNGFEIIERPSFNRVVDDFIYARNTALLN